MGSDRCGGGHALRDSVKWIRTRAIGGWRYGWLVDGKGGGDGKGEEGEE